MLEVCSPSAWLAGSAHAPAWRLPSAQPRLLPRLPAAAAAAALLGAHNAAAAIIRGRSAISDFSNGSCVTAHLQTCLPPEQAWQLQHRAIHNGPWSRHGDQSLSCNAFSMWWQSHFFCGMCQHVPLLLKALQQGLQLVLQPPNLMPQTLTLLSTTCASTPSTLSSFCPIVNLHQDHSRSHDGPI